MIAPNSRIILLKSPIELDNINQITFNNSTDQYNYFYGLNKIELINATFQRKDNTLRFPTENNIDFDELQTYNYCMYQNTNYSTKWFYAFINECKYINDGMSEIVLKTDVFQTWQFDITFKASFIEREHISKSDDILGANTVPENLETGEYISTKLQPTNSNLGDTCYVVATSMQVLTSYSIFQQDIPTGCYYQAFDSLWGVYDFINKATNDHGSEVIVNVFVAPKSFFSAWTTVTGITGNVSTTTTFSLSLTTITVDHVNYLGNDYTPVNKKLLSYPYSFLQVSNHSGSVANYHWEDFNLISAYSDGNYYFKMGCVLTAGCSGFVYPYNYKNILNNHDEGLSYGKFPIGAWNTDTYTNWLTQNGVNIPLQIAGGVISAGAGLLTGNPIGTASGILSISQTLGSIYEHSLIPNQASGNVNAGEFNFSYSWLSMEFKRISIKNEYAKIIDDYFSMFGYATHKVKLPNLNNRSNWNYVKTVNCNLIGDIPQKDMQEIKEMFNNGVTLWHTTTYFLDYSQNNN